MVGKIWVDLSMIKGSYTLYYTIIDAFSFQWDLDK